MNKHNVCNNKYGYYKFKIIMYSNIFIKVNRINMFYKIHDNIYLYKVCANRKYKYYNRKK